MQPVPGNNNNNATRAVPSPHVATSNGFATSNVTSQLFLGSQQRSWMYQSPSAGVAHSAPPPTNSPSKPTAPPRNASPAFLIQGSPSPMLSTVVSPAGVDVAGNTRQDQNISRMPAYQFVRETSPNPSTQHHRTQWDEMPRQETRSEQPNLDGSNLNSRLAASPVQASARSQDQPPTESALLPATVNAMVASQTLSPSASPPQWQGGTQPILVTEGSRKRSLAGPEEDIQRGLRIRTSTSSFSGVIASPISQPSTPLPAPSPTAALHLPKLNQILAQLRSQGKSNQIVEQRSGLLQDACAQDDMFYLCLHQTFTRLTQAPLSAMEISFGPPQMRGFLCLESILLPNQQLPPEANAAFANFPVPAILTRSSELAPYIPQVKVFLPILSANWDLLRRNCFQRGFPPCARELRSKLSIPSIVLQRTFFNSIVRQLGASEHHAWQQSVFAYFVADQRHHFQKLNQPDGHESLNRFTEAAEISAFGQGYFQLRTRFFEVTPTLLPQHNGANAQESPSLTTHSSVAASSATTNHPAQTYHRTHARPPPPPSRETPVSQSNLSSTQGPSSTDNGTSVNLSWTSAAQTAQISSLSNPNPIAQPVRRTGQVQLNASGRCFVPVNSAQYTPNQVSFPPSGQLPQRRSRGRPPQKIVAPHRGESNFRVTSNSAPTTNIAQQDFTVSSQGNPAQLRQDLDYLTPQAMNRQAAPVFPSPDLLRSASSAMPVQGNNTSRVAVPLQMHRFAISPAQYQMPSPIRGMQSFSFLPPATLALVPSTNPNPDSMAMHQAHLRSPEPQKLNLQGVEDSQLRLYQYFDHFELSPRLLPAKRSYFIWELNISIPDMAETAKDILPPQSRPDLPPQRRFAHGSRVYRLRCVQVPKGLATIGLRPSEWAVAATSWPSCCFLSLNNNELELRRKSHHGRDLALDLTSFMKQGINTVTLSIHRSKDEEEKCFAVAVEVVRVVDHDTALKMPTRLSSADALAAIKQSLASSGGDDELQMVDQHISIDLLDPFMSTAFSTPVRGSDCLHRECFDLDAFLQSRTSRVKGGPTNPDEWRCPICGKDARPSQLVLDEFLLGVREKLEKDGMLETKAIFVNADGSWKPKVLNDAEGAAKKGGERREATKEEKWVGNAHFAQRATTVEQVLQHLPGRREIVELDD